MEASFLDFFFLFVGLGLNSGPHTCKAGAVLLQPLLQVPDFL
jgi:hypothetical protein